MARGENFLYLRSIPGWNMRQETITLQVLKWPGVQSRRVPRKRKAQLFLKSRWEGCLLFVIHIEIKDSLRVINERWATEFCMCWDLFPHCVWVCIFVCCCAFTSFGPGEGAELAKTAAADLSTQRSVLPNFRMLASALSLSFFSCNDFTFSDKIFQEWHYFAAAELKAEPCSREQASFSVNGCLPRFKNCSLNLLPLH